MQFDKSDCAAACLATVCKFYRKEITINVLRDILGTDMKGTNLTGLENGAKQLGFEAKTIRVNKDEFVTPFTVPAIAHVVTKEGISHFVVIHKISNSTVTYLDPAKGKVKESVEEFWECFTGVLLLLIPGYEFSNQSYSDEKSLLLQFIKLLKPQKKLFIYSILASIFLTIFGIASSLFSKILIDDLIPGQSSSQLQIFVLFFLCIGLSQTILSFVRQHMLLYLSQKIEMPLLLNYFKHVFKLPMKFFMNRSVGDILTRFNDAFVIKDIFTSLVLTLLLDIVLTIASGTVLYFINDSLFFVVLLLVFVNALLVYLFKSPYKRINIKQVESSARLNGHIIESLKGIETLKMLSAEKKGYQNIEREYIRTLKISFKEGLLSNTQELLSTSSFVIGNMGIMYIGAVSVMKGDITLGTLLAFLTLSQYFMDPIGRLIELQLSIQEANISLKRLSEIYSVKQEKDDAKNPRELLKGSIKFRNIQFSYGGRSPVLKGIDLNIQSGNKIAIVGPSGSGKSTIAKLLIKYMEANKGEITIAGENINDIDVARLRQSIAYVPQKIELFSDTIRNNLLLGVDAVSQAEIEEACQVACCNEFIQRMPNKYDTYLMESGEGISGGEKQKIGLARTLLKKSDILVLDEATSNIDVIDESKIYQNIFKVYQKQTMIMIAHRLSTIRDCDNIYVVDQGKVVECGTHVELIKEKGLYFRMFSEQSEIQETDLQSVEDNESVSTTYEKNIEVTEFEYR
ncbi:peptidase domain-containing ABC transporter [Exiguobacterium sp. OS-77]|uniref:peptidase domain-containing ABC transporter n=1 Tax=Exiguobacterium sp. OS-77 TaxID=1241306 RepID=UPI000403D00B|nr:peptidase domain-containing ABC transporter [Exiguobacterium sp. OS-77]